MKSIRFSMILILVYIPGQLAQASTCPEQPALLPAMWESNFENGHIDAWSSYPPFEDTAYDFTIFPGSYKPKSYLQGYLASGERFFPVELAPPAAPVENRFYLLRAYRPNSTSPQRIGVSHKIQLYVDEASMLSFDYWLNLTASPAELRLELAGADGKRYACVFPKTVRQQWQHMEIPFARFRNGTQAPPANLEVQAVNIIAEYKYGDASQFYFLALDNVRLTGKRRAGFAVQTPKVRHYRHWPMVFCERHYYTGDRLDVRVIPELQGAGTVTVSLIDLTGHLIVDDAALLKSDSTWQKSNLYTFRLQDARGPWTLIFKATLAGGKTVETHVRLWVLNRPPAGHPRLFGEALQRNRLLARMQTGRGKEIWQAVLRQAEQGRNAVVPQQAEIDLFPGDYLLPQLGRYFLILRTNARNALLNAFVHYVSGDSAAGHFARETLLRMARWQQWVHPWFLRQGRRTYYPVGITAMELAITYDFIYPLLSQDERRQIRQGILKNGIANAYREYFIQNRMPNHTSNWISHNTAGPATALMAFYGEFEADSIQANGEPYFSGLMEKFITHTRATLKADGGYGEGYGYQNFTLSTAWPALAALNDAFGADLVHWLHFDRSHLFPLYIATPAGRELLDMGDSADHLTSMSNWAWLVAKTSDPLMQDFYARAPGNEWEDFLWAPPAAGLPATETMPPSRIFPDKGNAVFRTGWRDNDVVFAYRAGPNFNHTHADQGNFRLWAFGEHLVGEAGKGGYYTDPYYWSFFIQAAGHNVVLIDGNPESQEVGDFANEIVAFQRRAGIEQSFVSPAVSFVSSELGPVYRNVLSQFQRSVHFIEPGYVIIRDRIRSRTGPHYYQWQLIAPEKSGLQLSRQAAQYRGGKAWLQIAAVMPAEADLKMIDAPVPIGEYAKYPQNKLKPRGILQIANAAPAEAQDFLVVLFPHRNAEPAARVEKISANGYSGVRIANADMLDELYFADEGSLRTGLLRTDARSALVRRAHGVIAGYFVQTGTRVAFRDEVVLEARVPVDALWQDSGTVESWHLQAHSGSRVHLKISRPGKVKLTGNGRVVLQTDRRIELQIDTGVVELKIYSSDGGQE